MAYILTLSEVALFTLIGAAITLASALRASLRFFFAFAWRLWLWGTIGLIVGNLALFGALSPFLVGIGIAGGSAVPISARDFLLTQLILFGPLLVTSLGILIGCLYGWRRAQGRAHSGV
jgi:hypothetical protein